MINNPEELKSVQRNLDKFKLALSELKREESPYLIELQMRRDSLSSFINEFNKEIREYQNLFGSLSGKNVPSEHDCIIAVDELGVPLLLKSEPSLYEHDLFDGRDLRDNVNFKEHDVPTEFGIYKCKIMVQGFTSNTQEGIEYDMNTWIEDVVKIEI